jgi:signal transduction histidine kinase
MAPSSVRMRLMLLAVAGICATLALAGVTLDQVFIRHIENRAGDDLRVRMLELVALMEFADGDRRPITTRPPSDPRYGQPYSGLYWQVSENRNPVLRSRSLWDRDIPWWPGPESQSAQRRPGPLGRTMLGVEQTVLVHDGQRERPMTVTVGLDYAEIDRLRRAFTADVSLVLAIIATVLVVWAWLQTSLGIRPLRLLRAQLEQIRKGQARRLEGRLVGEISPVVDELNHLLDHQERQARKARERAGALAHGLKTPLTILQGEIAGLEARGDQETAKVLRNQLSLMHTHVERELARARSNGTVVNGAAFAGAVDLVDRLIQLVRHMPRGASIEWANLLPDDLHILIDPSDFGEIVGNLLDNARKWARSEVFVHVMDPDPWDHALTIVVDDDGPGIPNDQRARVLLPGERFAVDVEGSGLGLSIVNGMLADYGSALLLSRNPAGGLRASFALPGWIATADGPQARERPGPLRDDRHMDAA